MKAELRLGPPSIEVEYPHNLDGRKPYRPNFVELLQTAQAKETTRADKETLRDLRETARARTQTIRFWVLLGAIGVDIIACILL